MTGPEHYREGERLLVEARTVTRPNDEGHCEADRMIAEALAHFAAAQAAATALLGPVAESGYDDADLDAWREVAGAKGGEGQ